MGFILEVEDELHHEQCISQTVQDRQMEIDDSDLSHPIVSCSPVQCGTDPVPHCHPLVPVMPTHVFVVLLSIALLSLLSLQLQG